MAEKKITKKQGSKKSTEKTRSEKIIKIGNDVSEINLLKSFDSFTNGVAVITNKFDLIYSNENLKLLIASKIHDSPTFIGRNIIDIFPEFKESEAAEKLNVCVKSNTSSEFQTKINDNEFEIRVIPLKKKNLALLFLRNYSINRISEELVQRSEFLLRLHMKGTTIAVLVHCNDKILFINNSAVNFFGYDSADPLIGTNIYEILPEEFKKIFIEKSDNIFSDIEIQFNNKSGNIVNTVLVTIPIIYENKSAYLSFIHDMTEVRKLQEKLTIQQKMDSLGTLAREIANDFNNILAGIMGCQELISDSTLLSPVERNLLERSIRLCAQAGKITTQLLSFASLDISEKIHLDLHRVIDEVLKVLSSTTDSIIYKINHLEKNKYFVLGNYAELREVFMNLGINSVQAIKTKGIKYGDVIEIWAEENMISDSLFGLPKGKYIHIYFQDNGCGMSESVKARAFEPLFSTREKGAQGSQGLGLTKVYNIITNRHDGHIYLESAIDKGTTVHIYLPKAQEQPATISQKTFLGKNETILIIDDDENLIDITKKIIERNGYNVITALSGSEGIKLYLNDKDSINLVILDLLMPMMSGTETLKLLTEINPDIKVIISTGHSDLSESKHIPKELEAAKCILAKPFAKKELLETLRDVLDK